MKDRTAPLRSGWCDEALAMLPPSEEPTLRSATTRTARRPARPPNQGPEGKVGNRGIAADSGCVLRRPQLFAVKLRQAVDESAEPFRGRVLLFVPLLPIRRVP